MVIRKTRKDPNSAGRSERGAAFVELVIVLPVLFLLSFAVSDISIFLQNYLKLEHIAREAIRFSVAIPGYEQLNCTAVGMSPLARRGTSSNIHQTIQGRIQRLVQTENLEIDPSTLRIQTFCGGTGNDRVRVTLQATYRPMLAIPYWASPLENGGPGLFSFSMTSEGEYLFQNCAARPTTIPTGCS